MAEKDIRLSLNGHKLEALRQALYDSDMDVEEELMLAFENMYKKFVPSDERAKVDSIVAREEEFKSRPHMAVIRLRDDRDEFSFTTDSVSDFYSVSSIYLCDVIADVKTHKLDSLAYHFGEYEPINDTVYSVLCDAMPNDNRISILVDFDFENDTVSVCDSSDDAWRTYELSDISNAVIRADKKYRAGYDTQREAFEEALVGKEVTHDNGQDESDGITLM